MMTTYGTILGKFDAPSISSHTNNGEINGEFTGIRGPEFGGDQDVGLSLKTVNARIDVVVDIGRLLLATPPSTTSTS